MNTEALVIIGALAAFTWVATILAFMFGCRFGREHAIRQLADEMHGELEELP